MSVNDISPILALIERLDASKPSRFSFTQAAFDNNDIEGVENFDINNAQNIPLDTKTDYDPLVLDRGARTQAASIPRMAWDHFIGRFSYNIAKLTQQVLAFFRAEKKAWAHNAFEYDALAEYLTGDVCYVVEAVDSVSTISYFKRVSVTPLKLTGVSPLDVGQTDWDEMELRSNLFPLLPVSSKGYRHRYSLIDLSNTGVYDVNTWYPVTTAPFQAMMADDDNTLQVLFEAYSSGLSAGNNRAELGIISKFTGFTGSSTSIVLNDSFISLIDGAPLNSNDNPIGFSILPLGKQAVVWLRGGAPYALWNSFGAEYTVRTASYDNGSDAPIVPNAGRVFSYAVGKVAADVDLLDGKHAYEIAESIAPNGMWNVGLAAAVAANALTISLKQKDGVTNPGVNENACKVNFRISPVTSGGFVTAVANAATSTVISSGSTAGLSAGVEDKLFIYAINNAGVIELAWSTSALFDEGTLQTTTAEGGAGAADSRAVLYSTVARANVAVRLIGYIVVTEAVAGVWATAPSKIALWSHKEEIPNVRARWTSPAAKSGTGNIDSTWTVQYNSHGFLFNASKELVVQIAGMYLLFMNVLPQDPNAYAYADIWVDGIRIASGGGPAGIGVTTQATVNAPLYLAAGAKVQFVWNGANCYPSASIVRLFN